MLSVDAVWMDGGHMVPWAPSIRRAALASRACMVMDDVDNAGHGRPQAAGERKAEDQSMAFLVRQGDWVTPRKLRSTCVT